MRRLQEEQERKIREEEEREAAELKALEDENRRLKEIVADLTLDNKMLKHLSEGNW